MPLDIIKIPNLAKKINNKKLEFKNLLNKISLYSSGPKNKNKDNISNISINRSNINFININTPYKTNTRILKNKKILIL